MESEATNSPTTMTTMGEYLLSKKWDPKTQTPHGGQEWRELPNFVEDFSVTTNPLGPPRKALKAASEALMTIEHYPASDHEPALGNLADFMEVPKSKLLLGNGASELIDLVIRMAPNNSGKWKPGPFLTQYKEYDRSAKNSGYETVSWSDLSADLTCIVNPCNPTGDYLPREELQEFIGSSCKNGSWVLVDESMQPWVGPNWREESLTSDTAWMTKMLFERNIAVFVIHSWTKLWACPGMRLGSVLCPSETNAETLRKMQVPWSVNTMALAFLSACCEDSAYLSLTWETTTSWRKAIVNQLSINFPHWKLHGKDWSSWVWIDTQCPVEAEACVAECKAKGVPIRWGKFGYNLPSFVRVGIRHPDHVKVLVQAMKEGIHQIQVSDGSQDDFE